MLIFKPGGRDTHKKTGWPLKRTGWSPRRLGSPASRSLAREATANPTPPPEIAGDILGNWRWDHGNIDRNIWETPGFSRWDDN